MFYDLDFDLIVVHREQFETAGAEQFSKKQMQEYVDS
jgi:hypothetical protein